MKCLMLGAGHAPPKRSCWLPETAKEWCIWTTLDVNEDCKPDVVYNLNLLCDPTNWHNCLPFKNEMVGATPNKNTLVFCMRKPK